MSHTHEQLMNNILFKAKTEGMFGRLYANLIDLPPDVRSKWLSEMVVKGQTLEEVMEYIQNTKEYLHPSSCELFNPEEVEQEEHFKLLPFSVNQSEEIYNYLATNDVAIVVQTHWGEIQVGSLVRRVGCYGTVYLFHKVEGFHFTIFGIRDVVRYAFVDKNLSVKDITGITMRTR